MSDALIIGIIVALAVPVSSVVTVVMAQAFTWVMKREERRNDLADRAEVAKQARLAAQSAQHAARVAAETARVATDAMAAVHAAVEIVGEKADASYKEANNANLKIQAVQDVLTKSMDLPTVPITNSTGADDPKEIKNQ